MTADTTNAADLPGPAAASGPSNADRAEQGVARLEHAAAEVWIFLRFLLFVGYLLIGVLVFWLWVMTAAVGLIRFVGKALMLVLLWLAGGTAPRHRAPAASLTAALKREFVCLWDLRLVAYEEFVRPLDRNLRRFGRAVQRFGHWSLIRKGCTLIVIGWLVVVPSLYLIPRPHHVQITDDNAVVYDKTTNKTTYLVHALDLRAEDKTREYINEDAWYLGKINSQGLKSQLQHGRTYRLWVVGIRWYYLPTLYPNIISATEIDAAGNAVEQPARLAAPAQAPR